MRIPFNQPIYFFEDVPTVFFTAQISFAEFHITGLILFLGFFNREETTKQKPCTAGDDSDFAWWDLCSAQDFDPCYPSCPSRSHAPRIFPCRPPSREKEDETKLRPKFKSFLNEIWLPIFSCIFTSSFENSVGQDLRIRRIRMLRTALSARFLLISLSGWKLHERQHQICQSSFLRSWNWWRLHCLLFVFNFDWSKCPSPGKVWRMHDMGMAMNAWGKTRGLRNDLFLPSSFAYDSGWKQVLTIVNILLSWGLQTMQMLETQFVQARSDMVQACQVL